MHLIYSVGAPATYLASELAAPVGQKTHFSTRAPCALEPVHRPCRANSQRSTKQGRRWSGRWRAKTRASRIGGLVGIKGRTNRYLLTGRPSRGTCRPIPIHPFRPKIPIRVKFMAPSSILIACPGPRNVYRAIVKFINRDARIRREVHNDCRDRLSTTKGTPGPGKGRCGEVVRGGKVK